MPSLLRTVEAVEMNQLFNLSHEWLERLEPFPAILALDLIRYLVAALLITGVIALASQHYRMRRSVRTRQPIARQRRREFAYSVASVFVFAIVGTGVYLGAVAGIFRISDEPIASYGWVRWGLGLLLVVVAHDAYFYWTHRLMHHKAIFAWMHRTHHRSVAPTQWAAYSFAPSEAFVQAMFLPIFLLMIPSHASVLVLWMIHQVARNVLGHSGYELMPKRWLATWWGRWLTTTLHHDLHHGHTRGNYGLYFTWWDRWCGTEREDYRARLAALIARIEAPTFASTATRESKS